MNILRVITNIFRPQPAPPGIQTVDHIKRLKTLEDSAKNDMIQSKIEHKVKMNKLEEIFLEQKRRAS